MKLVALVDGSTYTRSVADHAAWIVGRTGATLDLLHAIGRRETSSAPTNLSGSISLGARTALLQELSTLDEQRARLAQKRGRAILDDVAELLSEAGVTATPRLRTGDLIEAIEDAESDVDMIVVGKRGEAADFAKLHLGSNLERVVRGSKKPVLVASRAFKPINRFLIAYDGSASAMRAVDHVARSPLFSGLECHIVTVGEDKTETRRKLEGAVALLKGGGHTVTASVVPGQPERAISAYVENEGIDLLAMGSHGHSRIRQLIIGSSTTAMLRSCKIPIVVFR
ncbi:universal stress protein [Acuticoccus sp. MNP-M23]|uniref:universal stress protein n=1 Tax=Acuticoccus sp. MNP-M23 TaxID=3072793 RepID=UPI00281602A7|nr:universal stress protein [Acuticoccus sp. MNP-M23]WMS41607.1 universal stress protein [Acuticoccus sp. MNP-M23]